MVPYRHRPTRPIESAIPRVSATSSTARTASGTCWSRSTCRRDCRSSRRTSSASIWGSPTSPPTPTGRPTLRAGRREGPPEAQPPTQAAPAQEHQGEQEEDPSDQAEGSRFRRHQNHVISKRSSIRQTHRSRDRPRRPQRHPRSGHGSGRRRTEPASLGLLPTRLVHRLQGETGGRRVEYVDPRNTSRTCSDCGTARSPTARASANSDARRVATRPTPM